MVNREQMLEDLKAAGECDYCKHDSAEMEYWEGERQCQCDCLNCEIQECPCNGCINFSKWEYYREEADHGDGVH